MRKWEKVFWALLAGTAIGAAGCGDDSTVEYGPPADVPQDSVADTVDAEDGIDVVEDLPVDADEEEQPMTEYGPVSDF